jgi:site-specific recombinase XerD
VRRLVVHGTGEELEERRLTAAKFQQLNDVPAEVEWFANIQNLNTRRAYRNDVQEFMRFAGLRASVEFRLVKRSHLIAWRQDLQSRSLEPSSVRRKLSALASLFDYLCESNAVPYNPADGVKRPNAGASEGKSPALSDAEAKAILNAPQHDTLKGLRDRAILSVLLYHGLRRAELCALSVGAIESRRGVLHFAVEGKGGKLRFVPIHPQTLECIHLYLAKAGHNEDMDGPLFRSVQVRGGRKALSGNAVYQCVVKKYGQQIGIDPRAICVHGLRATAATNALDHQADIAKVQEWLGHASINTTRLYDRRGTKAEDSPTFKVSY